MMWRLSESGSRMLRSWIEEGGNSQIQMEAKFHLKDSSVVMSYDELMSLLQPFISDKPIYKVIDELQLEPIKEEKRSNPAYQERILKLRKMQEEKEYREMTKSVDLNQIYGRDTLMRGFGEELRCVNRHLMVIFNTLITVAGAFAFGFYGIDYAYSAPNLSVTTRLVVGLLLAGIVFSADLYFIVTRLDELGDKPIKCYPRFTNCSEPVLIQDEINYHTRFEALRQ